MGAGWVTTGLGLPGAARWVGGVSGAQAGCLLSVRPSADRAAGGHGVRQLRPCRLPTRAGCPAGGRGGTCRSRGLHSLAPLPGGEPAGPGLPVPLQPQGADHRVSSPHAPPLRGDPLSPPELCSVARRGAGSLLGGPVGSRQGPTLSSRSSWLVTAPPRGSHSAYWTHILAPPHTAANQGPPAWPTPPLQPGCNDPGPCSRPCTMQTLTPSPTPAGTWSPRSAQNRAWLTSLCAPSSVRWAPARQPQGAVPWPQPAQPW